MTPPENSDHHRQSPPAGSSDRRLGRRLRLLGSALVVLAAGAAGACLRLVDLDNRPMHCDEGNQAVKFGRLLEDQHYVYDPREHHGPSLNYLTLPVAWARGRQRLAELSEADLRMLPAIFGSVLVLAVCLLGRQLGAGAVGAAALLTAFSPAMVFYSRYYIHETLLVMFTFTALAALCGFARAAGNSATGTRQSAGRWWLRAGPWVAGFGFSAAMMHASKETCVIALAAMLLPAVFLFWRDAGTVLVAEEVPARPAQAGPDPPGVSRSSAQPNPAGAQCASRWTGQRTAGKRILAAAVVAVVLGASVSALMFSSFGRNPRGVLDSYTTYFYYLGRASGEGTTGRHVQPWHYYFRILFGPQRGDTAWWPEGKTAPQWLAKGPLGKWPAVARLATEPLYWPELPVALLALPGLVAAVWGRGMRVECVPAARFLACYTLLMIAVYSAMPYKTPWCALSFLHGMILLAGMGTSALWTGFVRPAAQVSPPHRPAGGTMFWRSVVWGATCRLCALLLLAAAVGWLGWQTWITSFRAYEDPASPFVYSHTTSEVLDLVATVERIALAQPEGRNTYIQVVCPEHDYWPLPWYLRRFERVAWLDRPPQGPPAPLIITQPKLRGALIDYIYVKQPPGQRRLYLPLRGDDGREKRWQLRPYVPLEVLVRLDVRERYLRSLPEQPLRVPR